MVKRSDDSTDVYVGQALIEAALDSLKNLPPIGWVEDARYHLRAALDTLRGD